MFWGANFFQKYCCVRIKKLHKMKLKKKDFFFLKLSVIFKQVLSQNGQYAPLLWRHCILFSLS